MNIKTMALWPCWHCWQPARRRQDDDHRPDQGSGTVATQPGIVPGSEEDLKTNVGDRVFLCVRQVGLMADGKETLDRQSAWLGKYGQVSVQIAGNCDGARN